MGVDALMEAIELVRNDAAPKISQDPDAGTYEGWCGKADAAIDWSQPADHVYNLIRGTNPQPGAWTTVKGAELKIFDSVLEMGDSDAAPGTINRLSDDGFSVASPGGQILVQRVRPAGSGKVAAAEFASTNGLSVGDRLGD